jgi:hypothetical protein
MLSKTVFVYKPYHWYKLKRFLHKTEYNMNLLSAKQISATEKSEINSMNGKLHEQNDRSFNGINTFTTTGVHQLFLSNWNAYS